jgi:hypothetical protein
MNTNPVGNSKPGIHKGKPAKANQVLKLATSSTRAAALLLALNYFPTVAEAGTMPPTDTSKSILPHRMIPPREELMGIISILILHIGFMISRECGSERSKTMDFIPRRGPTWLS